MNNSENSCLKIFKKIGRPSLKLQTLYLHLAEQLIKKELKNRLNKSKKMQRKEERVEKDNLKIH